MEEMAALLLAEHPGLRDVLALYQEAEADDGNGGPTGVQVSEDPENAPTPLADDTGEPAPRSTKGTRSARRFRPQGVPRLCFSSIAPENELPEDRIETAAAEWSRMHGQLIAYGLLNVTIVDAQTGMLYQPTPLSRRLMLRLAGAETATDTDFEQRDEEEDIPSATGRGAGNTSSPAVSDVA